MFIFQIENVCVVDGGISAGAWSPDLELLVLASADRLHLQIMGRNFDILSRHELQPASFGQGLLCRYV